MPLLDRLLTDDRNDQDVVRLFSDTQGFILESHGCDYVWHFFIRFTQLDPLVLRGALAFRAGYVTNTLDLLDDLKRAREGGGPTHVSSIVTAMGISPQGCRKMRISTVAFDPDFLPFRSRAVSLTSQSDDSWEDVWRDDAGFDAIIICAAPDEAPLHEALAELTQTFQGLALIYVEKGHVMRGPASPGHTRGRTIEHFGFADGISQPSLLEHSNPPPPPDRNPSAPARLVLVREAIDGASGDGCGSYMAFMKVEQHLDKFNDAVTMLAERYFNTANPTPAQCDFAAAMIIGRRKDGCPITNVANGCPGENNFGRSDDPSGGQWPFASHTSKMNPRTGTQAFARILRRGVTYTGEAGEHGLLFISFQSSYFHQFETNLRTWANSRSHPVTETGTDPIVGCSRPAAQHFPGVTDAVEIYGLTTIKGGEYFYFPSISALRTLPNRPLA